MGDISHILEAVRHRLCYRLRGRTNTSIVLENGQPVIVISIELGDGPVVDSIPGGAIKLDSDCTHLVFEEGGAWDLRLRLVEPNCIDRIVHHAAQYCISKQL
jgi:hypothetical protein